MSSQTKIVNIALPVISVVILLLAIAIIFYKIHTVQNMISRVYIQLKTSMMELVDSCLMCDTG